MLARRNWRGDWKTSHSSSRAAHLPLINPSSTLSTNRLKVSKSEIRAKPQQRSWQIESLSWNVCRWGNGDISTTTNWKEKKNAINLSNRNLSCPPFVFLPNRLHLSNTKTDDIIYHFLSSFLTVYDQYFFCFTLINNILMVHIRFFFSGSFLFCRAKQ